MKVVFDDVNEEFSRRFGSKIKKERILEVNSIEEGHDCLRSFITDPVNAERRAYWAMLVQDEDKLLVYERFNQPCLGEMRTYGRTHKDCTRPDDPRPGDLFTPFPKTGNPIAIVSKIFLPGSEIMIDPENSPYRNILKDFEVVASNDSVLKGLLIKDTKVDATTLVSLFRDIRGIHYNSLLLGVPRTFSDKVRLAYCWRQNKNPKRVYHANPRDVTGGTFFDRYAYNRPQVDYIFAYEENDERFNGTVDQLEEWVNK